MSCDPHLGQESRDPPTDLQVEQMMWLSSHPCRGVEEGVVPHTAQTRKEEGTGEEYSAGEEWSSAGERKTGLEDRLISLTGDSGSYSFSGHSSTGRRVSGQGLDILAGGGDW